MTMAYYDEGCEAESARTCSSVERRLRLAAPGCYWGRHIGCSAQHKLDGQTPGREAGVQQRARCSCKQCRRSELLSSLRGQRKLSRSPSSQTPGKGRPCEEVCLRTAESGPFSTVSKVGVGAIT